MKDGAEQRLMGSRLKLGDPAPLHLHRNVPTDPVRAAAVEREDGRLRCRLQSRELRSATDVARFVELATLTDGLQGAKTDLGGPQNLSLVQFVQTFAAALGVGSSIRHVPRAACGCCRWGAPVQPDFRPNGAGSRPHGHDRHGLRRDGAVAPLPSNSPHDSVRGGAARLRSARAGRRSNRMNIPLLFFGAFVLLAAFNAGTMTTLQLQHYSLYPRSGVTPSSATSGPTTRRRSSLPSCRRCCCWSPRSPW